MTDASRLSFRIDAQASDSQARAATFRTLHGEVATPLFMPVGTQAVVKAQTAQTLQDSGAQILLANTYHLLLRPGAEVFRRMGGIHRFMSWPGSVLTDSGGYQIFSLPHSREITEQGAVFQSYVDKRQVLLSPELSIETQVAIASDIMMALDQCVPATADQATARAAVDLTHRWAARSLAARGDSPQSLFAIVQGALFPELRRESADRLAEMPFDGFAIGGLAVGEDRTEREDMCELTAERMPRDKPRYLMGVGDQLGLAESVAVGVDMFDSVLPTRIARNSSALVASGRMNLRNAAYRQDMRPLDEACGCYACRSFSRAYLRHLVMAKEILGFHLLTVHNLFQLQKLTGELRAAVPTGGILALLDRLRAEAE